MENKTSKKEDENSASLRKTAIKNSAAKVSGKLTLGKLLKIALVDSKALRVFLTNFLLVYNIRAGIALLLRMITLLIKKPKQLAQFETLLGEKNLTFRVEAVRLGLFVGGFSGIYRAICHSLAQFTAEGKHMRWHSAVGGWFAGLSLYLMDKSWHRTLALYMATRAVQCAYNLAKMHGYWHFWGSDWAHGDSLLFILSSAQVMYAYVMRPETLPASYYKFIVRQGPIDEVMLQAVRDNNRGKAINLPEVMSYIKKTGGEEALEKCKEFLLTDKPDLIPCRALHPYTRYCTIQTLNAFKGTAKQIFPVYLSLALVPAIVLRFNNFVKAPTSVLTGSLFSAIRSTTFLAVFCSGYMAFICGQREVIQHFRIRDHKLWYYVAGVFSSLAILIERKSRRSELALYSFPRALDSLYMILYDHQLAFRVPQGEILLFCTAMSSVMWFYDNETDCLSPLVAKLMDRFLPNKKAQDSTKRVKIAVEENEDSVSVATDSPRRNQAAFEGASVSSGEEADDETSQVNNESVKLERCKSNVSLSGGYSILP